jgi:hypothetical protein
MIILSASTPYAHASTVNVTVDKNSVSLNISLELRENFTSLPLLPSISLDGSNSSVVTQPVQTAMQRLVPTATIQQFQLHAGTKEIIPQLNMWSLEVNYTMTVANVNSNLGGTIRSNLAFLPMNVSQSLLVSSFELNNVGRTYLLSAVKSIQTTRTTYFDSGHIYLNTVVPGNDTAAFNLFDFTWIPFVSTWSGTYAPLDTTTRWTYSPLTGPYNVTAGQITPENTFLPVYTAFVTASLELDSPGRAIAAGYSVSFDVPLVAETLMPVTIVVALAVALATFVFDWRLTGKVGSKKRRK